MYRVPFQALYFARALVVFSFLLLLSLLLQLQSFLTICTSLMTRRCENMERFQVSKELTSECIIVLSVSRLV
ncbi:hypothetical protein HDV62DRAFT_366014 [Trichoderma sp. SZMC 28011]